LLGRRIDSVPNVSIRTSQRRCCDSCRQRKTNCCRNIWSYARTLFFVVVCAGLACLFVFQESDCDYRCSSPYALYTFHFRNTYVSIIHVQSSMMLYTAGATVGTARSVMSSYCCFIFVADIVFTCFAVGHRRWFMDIVPYCSRRLQERLCGCGVERKCYLRGHVPRQRVLFWVEFPWTGAKI
jgi:hypothetical protein